MSITNKSLANAHAWTPACGGTEEPFTVRGRRLQYMWNQISGEHAYYDLTNDVFLGNDEAFELLNPKAA